MSNRRVGPARAYIGNPTTAAGAGMMSLGDIEDVRIAPNLKMAFGSSAELAGAPDASALYRMPPAPEVQVQLHDTGLSILKEFLLGVSQVSTGTGGTLKAAQPLGDAFARIENPPTLAIIPLSEISDGVNAENGFWLPGVYISSIADIVNNRPSENEISNPMTVTFMGAYTEQDQASTPVSIQEGCRMGFFGPPGALTPSLSWSLPS